MKLTIHPAQAGPLAARIPGLAAAAREFSLFGEVDPDLARECGVEIGCLEARTLLSGGAPNRIAAEAAEAARLGRPAALEAEDLEAVSRLEAVVALGSARIALKQAALEAEASQEGLAKFGGLMGLATGAVGLIKSFF